MSSLEGKQRQQQQQQQHNYLCFDEFKTKSKRCQKVSDRALAVNPERFENRKKYATKEACQEGCQGFPEEEAEREGIIPLPRGNYRLDPQRVANYLDAFCDKTALSRIQKQAAAAILEETEIISFESFKDALRSALEKFAKKFPDIGALRWQPSPNIELTKSNTWVLFLCLHMMPILQKGMVMPPPPTEEEGKEEEEEKEEKKEKPEAYIFFDDAMYTGFQMQDNIRDTIKKVGSQAFQGDDAAEIIVISAFSTKEARDRLQEKFGDTIPYLYIFSGRDLHTIKDKLYRTYKNKIKALRQMFPYYNRYPYIFQHKMPDSVSSFPEIYSGYIPPISRSQFLSFQASGLPGSDDFSDFKEMEKEIEAECPGRAGPQLIPYLSGCIETFQESLKDEARSEFVASKKQCPMPPYRES